MLACKGVSFQSVDKVPHRSAGFFFVKCQKVQYL